jgi:hypothetical protein
MQCFPQLFVLPEHCQVFFGERVYHKDPTVKKIMQSLSIPPVSVVNPFFHSGSFSNGRNNVFENHEVKANIDVKDGRNESEKQLNELILLKALL